MQPSIVQWWFEPDPSTSQLRTKDADDRRGTLIGSEKSGQLHIWRNIRQADFYKFQRSGFSRSAMPADVDFD
jgi:hypothetical protein